MKRRILQRDSLRERRVETIELTLPGVSVNASHIPDAINFTHSRSGLSIVSEVPKDRWELAEHSLAALDWDTDVFTIFDSPLHLAVIRGIVLATNKQRSVAQESRIAEDLFGRVQPGSGSVWGYRRDVVTPTLLIECKTTTQARWGVVVKDLEYLKLQAYRAGKVPVFLVSFEAPRPFDVVLMPLADLMVVPDIESVNPIPDKSIWVQRAWYDELVALGKSYRFGEEDADSWIAMDYERFLLVVKQGELNG